MKITYEIAMAAGKDAANKHMKTAGRITWNEDDYNLAAEIASELTGISMNDMTSAETRILKHIASRVAMHTDKYQTVHMGAAISDGDTPIKGK